MHHHSKKSYRVIELLREPGSHVRKSETVYLKLFFDENCGVEKGVWLDKQLSVYVAKHDRRDNEGNPVGQIIDCAVMLGPNMPSTYSNVVARYDSPERKIVMRNTEENFAEKMLEYFRSLGLYR